MSRGGRCGRADLALALGRGGSELLGDMAALLGYEPTTPRPQELKHHVAGIITQVAEEPDPEFPSAPAKETPFWRPVRYQAVKPVEQQRPPPPVTRPVWRNQTKQPPPYRLLAPWRELEPRLRRGLGATRAGNELDIRRILRDLGRGRLNHRLPRCRRRAWGASLRIILDRSEHLVPFWKDQEQVCGDLARLFGGQALEIAVFHEGHDDLRSPPAGSTVLVLGDLGCLAGDGVGRDNPWLRLGERLAAAGCRAVALLPGPPDRCPEPLRRRWHVLPWERPQTAAVADRAGLRARAERLLRLISPAVRVEPGLLRDIRLSLPAAEADAGTEADLWQLPEIASTSSVAGTLDPKKLEPARAAFETEDREIRKSVLKALTAWRHNLPPEIFFEELRNLGPNTSTLCDPQDLADAEAFFNWLAAWRGVPPGVETVTPQAARAFIGRVKARATPRFWQGPVGALLQRWVYQEFDQFRPGFTLEAIEGGPEREITLWQVDDALVAAESEGGSLLATVRTANGLIAVEEDERAAFWKSGTPPPWAKEWGWDEFGAWVTFRVKDVVQKLRWIPPGSFLMGSPEDESGRWQSEGPQHPVVITQGFWLMDTPCTQALWQTVMRINPSRFKSPERPVEYVNKNDIQEFISRINSLSPGLNLALPSEAQWEYACRAGTNTPLYSGDIKIIGERNAPALDQIAWYGGNSGVNFDLQGGDISEGWKEKQYPHKLTGTRPVGKKCPNPWGLYDMLGNVWEWCSDRWRIYKSRGETDPVGPLEINASGVCRGGAWHSHARNTRSAPRLEMMPGKLRYSIGFRCSRVLEEAEPAEPRRVREAERPTAAGRPSGAVLRLDREESADRCPLPRVRAFQIRTDRERLSFSRFTQSDCGWADEIGRDRFGLWARFEIGEVSQRLRWLSPGRFLMGSPEGELGREADEGPQHEVTLAQGFWLMDTACTQALWQVVMGNNPSYFKDSPYHPVETVSWDEVQSMPIGLTHTPTRYSIF
ncbi:MAG: SUMF1/EgtB/PvdO family nonheme iron enzyme, partial [Rhodospirillaceae bacterium]